MRIVAGIHKGRVLACPAGLDTRPTADRARQALFNILYSLGLGAEGGRVMDCFAGTGALGLEALSRGWDHATFVETAPAALNALASNIATLGETARTTVLKADATRLPTANAAPADLAFLDPPYGKDMVAPTLSGLASRGWLAPGAVVVVETARDEALALPGGFTHFDERPYGAARINLLRW